jgi:DNA-binding transcriptional LysR family regulator
MGGVSGKRGASGDKMLGVDTTQPSISKVLARLRGYFADPLFIRDGNAMRPTPRALEIAGPLHGLLVASSILSRRGRADKLAHIHPLDRRLRGSS